MPVGSGYSQAEVMIRDGMIVLPGFTGVIAAAGITYLNGMDAASEAELHGKQGMTVCYCERLPGDLNLLFFIRPNGKYRNISHVAIYLGMVKWFMLQMNPEGYVNRQCHNQIFRRN